MRCQSLRKKVEDSTRHEESDVSSYIRRDRGCIRKLEEGRKEQIN